MLVELSLGQARRRCCRHWTLQPNHTKAALDHSQISLIMAQRHSRTATDTCRVSRRSLSSDRAAEQGVGKQSTRRSCPTVWPGRPARSDVALFSGPAQDTLLNSQNKVRPTDILPF
eukprot:scaffold1900_cov389-Prasinococcus_capsulatus_cf.AAC.29